MRFWFQILLVTGIAFGLSSCGFFGGGNEDDSATTDGSGTPQDQVVVVPNDVVDPNATTDPNADDGTTDPGAFGNPVVEGNISGDLIPSTSPEERLQQIERDRPDPFDILQTTPSIDIPPPEEVAALPPSINGGNGGNGGPGAPGSGGATPDGDPAAPDLEPVEPPPPPNPATAKAVAVTGVVQIGSVPYAIVSAPNEPTSRYVRTGQLLSNGQVLVKRIEMSPGVADPVVVLEEFGIEVSRQVGDNPNPSESEPELEEAIPPDSVDV